MALTLFQATRMRNKRLIHVLVLAAFVSATSFHARAASLKHPVKVILKNGDVIEGDMLGLDDGTLMIKGDSGKSQEIAVAKIKKLFDSDGKSIPLTASS